MVISIIILIIFLQFTHYITFNNLHSKICLEEYKNIKNKILLTEYLEYYIFKMFIYCFIPFLYTLIVMKYLLKNN